MNKLKIIILELFCMSPVRLKWVGGDISSSHYTILEATFQLTHYHGLEYAEVESGFFKGWRIK